MEFRISESTLRELQEIREEDERIYEASLKRDVDMARLVEVMAIVEPVLPLSVATRLANAIVVDGWTRKEGD